MSAYIAQSVATNIPVGPILDSSGAPIITAVLADLNVGKNGTYAALNGSAVLTHINNGYYNLAITTTDANTLGELVIINVNAAQSMPRTERLVIDPSVFTAFQTAMTSANGFADLQLFKGTAQTAADLGLLPKANFIRTGTAQGGSSSTITLDAGASSINSYYIGKRVTIIGGTGAGQSALIILYNGSTKVATVVSFGTAPDNTSVFVIQEVSVDMRAWNGVSVVVGSQGYPVVDVGYVNDVAQTGADLGLSALADLCRKGTAQAGASSSITLDSGASTRNNFYSGFRVYILSGTGSGQWNSIVSYVGSTKVATVANIWSTNPDNTSVFLLVAMMSDVQTWAGSNAVSIQGSLPNVNVGSLLAQTTSLSAMEFFYRGFITGTARNGGTSTTILLAVSGSPSTDDIIDGALIFIVNGGGGGQCRQVTGYVASTQTATVDRAWVTNPGSTSNYIIIPPSVYYSTLTAAGIRSAIGMASANLDQQLANARINTAQAGSSNTITLDAGASGTPNLYVNYLVNIISGTGAGQVRQITAYNASTKVATVDTIWSTNPDGTSVFSLTPSTAAAPQAAAIRTALGLAIANLDAQLGVARTGTSQNGATSSITLDAGASTIDNYYAGTSVTIVGSTGAGQTREIISYVGATKVATVDTPWITNPDNSSVFTIKSSVANVALWNGDTAPIVPFQRLYGNLRVNTAQAGAASTITLDAGASAVNGFYNNFVCFIYGGTGAGQIRQITGYVGSTKVATVDSAWGTNPDNTSTFVLVPAGAGGLTAAGVRTAIGLAAANLDQQLATIRIGTAQGGGASTITLDAGAIATDDIYKNALVTITSGTGAGQVRQIVSYVGSTQIATVDSAWAVDPDSTSVFTLIPASAGGGLDAAGVRAAIGMTLANLDTQLATIQSTITGISGAGATLVTVAQMGRPLAGTQIFSVAMRVYDSGGVLVDADSDPTLTATGQTSGDLSANLSAVSHPSTGEYVWAYTVSSTDTIEAITFEGSLAISTVNFDTLVVSQVTTIFTATDHTDLDAIHAKLPSRGYLAGATLNTGAIDAADILGGVGMISSNLDSQLAGIAANASALVLRLTSARAGYLDNLNVGGAVASHADILALNQSSSRHMILTGVHLYEIPESGTETYTVEMRTFNDDGVPTDADTTPTLNATGVVSGSLNANLSVASHPATGLYRWTYSQLSTAAIEEIHMDGSATISSTVYDLRLYTQSTNMAQDDAMITAIYNKLPSRAYLSGSSQTDGSLDAADKTGFALTSAYDAAKTAAQAGDAMALTSGERSTLTGVFWNTLVSTLTTASTIGKFLVDQLANAVPTAAGIATSVWAAGARTLTAATNITSTGAPTFTQTGDAFVRLGAPTLGSIAADINNAGYYAVIDFHRNPPSGDEYTVTWFKVSNQITTPILSGITLPTIQVVLRSDGTNLIPSTSMTPVSTAFKYDEPTNLLADGTVVIVTVTATIDGLTRTWFRPLGRDKA